MTETRSIDRSHLPRLGAAAMFCIAVAASLQEYFARDWGVGPAAYFKLFLAEGVNIAAWAVLLPIAIVPMVRRAPLSAGGFLAHGLAGGALAIIQTLIAAMLLATYFYGWSPLAIRDIFFDRLEHGFAWKVTTYLIIVTGVILWLRGRSSELAPAPVEVGELRPSVGHLRRVLVRSDGRVTLVQADQISWLEADDNNVVVHASGARHVIRGTLTHYADRLDPARFVRVHRSAVVNLDFVREVQTWFAGDLVAILADDTRVNVGRTYRDEFMARLEG